MAEQLERLVVSLEASITKYERAMQRALGQTNSTARRIEQRFSRMGAVVNGRLGAVGAGLLAGVSLQGAQQVIDASTRIQNALKVAGLAGDDLAAVYDRLFVAAQRNAAPIESLVTLYGRAATVQKELGVSTEDLLRFTENVSLALRVAGTDAQTSSGALLQLSQALGSGVVRAEEFNSMLEGALPIVQAAAAGLTEAGGSVAKLRQLVIDGKVSSEAFFRAFEAGSVTLQDKVSGAESTVSQSFVRLQNVLIDVAGQFNDGTDASRILSEGLDGLGQTIRDLSGFLLSIAGPMESFIGDLGRGLEQARAFAAAIAQVTGAERLGFDASVATNNLGLPGLTAESTAAGRVINQTFSIVGQTPEDQALLDYFAGVKTSSDGTAPTATATKPVVQPVSLADFAAPTRDKAAGAAARQASAVKDLIADLEFENSLIGQSAQQQEVMNALRRAGAAATDEQRARIEELVNAGFVERQQVEALQEVYSQLEDVGRSALNSLVDAMADGKIEGQELLSILGDITSQLTKMFLNNAFSNLLGGGSGGFDLSKLFQPRAAGGPVQAGRPYIVGERQPELFVPRTSGTILPSVGGGAQKVVNNVFNYGGDRVETRGNSSGGIDVIIAAASAAAEQRVEKNMARGKYRSFGVSPGVRRT